METSEETLKYYLSSGGLDSIPKENFSNFDPGKQKDPKSKRLAEEMVINTFNWVKEELTPFLAIFGNTGVGKTHMCRASAYFLASYQESFIHMTNQRFITIMKDFDKHESISSNELISDLMNRKFLIFDEIGFQYDPSGWLTTTLDGILIHRFDEELPTLICGNVQPKGQILTDRLKSRMKEKTMFTVTDMWDVKDYRGSKK